MAGELSRSPSRAPVDPEAGCQQVWRSSGGVAGWSEAEVDPRGSKDRLARLARAIETDVIPRLVQAHRPPGTAIDARFGISDADVHAFVMQVIGDSDAVLAKSLTRFRERGASIGALYIELFGPAAHQLGLMWEEDLCDFSTVTVALGRLQRLLRELSPAFGAEVAHPVHGRRALFVQPRDEQHSFGLSMVAEFFRRSGWDVLGGVGGAVADPAAKVREEWVDIVGFSVGSDSRLPWLVDTLRQTRAQARNRELVLLVGGPPFALNPELVHEVGADGTARDAREAPEVAERLLAARCLSR